MGCVLLKKPHMLTSLGLHTWLYRRVSYHLFPFRIIFFLNSSTLTPVLSKACPIIRDPTVAIVIVIIQKHIMLPLVIKLQRNSLQESVNIGWKR